MLRSHYSSPSPTVNITTCQIKMDSMPTSQQFKSLYEHYRSEAKFVVLVTGAGSGIGRAVALKLLQGGHSVVCADCNTAGTEETVRQATAQDQGLHKKPASERVLLCHVDVVNSVSCAKMVEATVARFGALDMAVNSAAIVGNRAKVAEMKEENWDRVMEVNLKGVFNCMQVELRQMMAQIKARNSSLGFVEREIVGQSAAELLAKVSRPDAPIDKEHLSIVNLSSITGEMSHPEFSPYSASKHAVIGLTRSAAKEYAPVGIRINAVSPAPTASPMTLDFQERFPDIHGLRTDYIPAGRISTVEDMAEAVVWLLLGSCPTIIGASLLVDGGIRA